MCTFCSDLPSNERGDAKKAFISLFLKPNDPNNPKDKYRFRLLNFRSPNKNDRKYPFISRYIHQHWGTNDEGRRVVDDLAVCPSSQFVDARNDASLGFSDTFKELSLKDEKPTWSAICPVCRQNAQAWNAYNNSGKTDRLALERAMSLKKQFQGIVPVYVVNDPVNAKNNGRFKCFIINTPEEYKKLVETVNIELVKIRKSNNAYDWCNGTNAVDFYVRVDEVPVQYKNGKQGKTRKITMMRFGEKAYDLLDSSGNEIITKDAIDKFEFDDQFYVKNSKEELEEFYKRHYSMASSNIPDEDIDMELDVTPAPAAPAKVSTKKPVQAPVPPVDDLVSDPDDIPFEPSAPAPKPAETQESAQSVEDLLSELDFNDDEP